jgi:hypothetical protein
LMQGLADALDKIPREEVHEAGDEGEEAKLEDIDAVEPDDPEQDDGGPSMVKKS